MALNTTTLETNLNTKMNATTGTTEGKEFLLLGKAVEALTPTVTVAAVIAEGTTQVARVTTEGTTQIAAVQAAGSGYASLTGATFTGDIDMGSNDITTTGKVLYSNVYSTTGDLPSASTYHGMFAHVHGTGKGYFAHGGNWIELVNVDTNGDLDVAGEFIADSYNETYAAVTSASNATTVNCEAGNSFSHTLTENTTFTFSNPPASGTAYSFSIEIIQDGSASGYTVTWPSTVDWPAATAPTLTATASAKDVFVFTTHDGGTNWYGFTAGQALG
jgi:hypothetical protein